jgi:mono/diheme cytochrome c family protein
MRTKFVLGLTLSGAFLCWSLVSAEDQAPKPETALIQSIQGPALYKAYCAACHGADGKGGGPMAQSLKVKPTDLTHISTRNGGKFPLTKIERIISGEQALPAGHGTRDMPLWGPIFSQIAWDQDLGRVRIDNLARFLRDMQLK